MIEIIISIISPKLKPPLGGYCYFSDKYASNNIAIILPIVTPNTPTNGAHTKSTNPITAIRVITFLHII